MTLLFSRRLIPSRVLIVVLSCGIGFTGCTVGPNYHRPPVPVPPAYRTVEPTTSSAPGSLGDKEWWKVFHDPVLQEHIRKARTSSPSLGIAAARVESVRAQIEGLRAAYSPEVTASANETLQRISPIGLPRNRTSGHPAGSATIFGAQATWEIDFWGKYRRASEAARATLLASQDAQQAVLASLVSDVATAYFDLLSLDEQHRLSVQALSLRQAALNLTLARDREGVSSAQDVQYAQAQVAEAKKQLEPVNRRIAERENELRTLEGMTSGAVSRGSSLWTESLPDLGPGLPSSLLERRPDLREAEQSLIAANANIGVAQSAYFPNIALTATGGQESTAFHNLFTTNASTWLLEPQLNVPVFTFGRIRAGVNQAKAEDQLLLSTYRATVISAFRDVADALAFRQSAKLLQAQQEEIVAGDARSAQLVHRQVEQGVSSSLEAISVDETVLAAQMSGAIYRGDELISVVHLYRALGGGWQP